jgi:serine phosphatase RsbU (regulator of sigma subunit)
MLKKTIPGLLLLSVLVPGPAVLASPLPAARPIIVDDGLRCLPLGRFIEYLEDANKSLSFDDIMSGSRAGTLPWVQSNQDSLGFGFSSKVYWIRFTVKNTAQAHARLYIRQEYPLINHLALYAPGDRGSYVETKTGSMHPFRQRPVIDRAFLFPLKVNAGELMTCYMRYESGSSMNINLTAFSPGAFIQIKDTEIIFYWLFYGILLALFIYNLIMFLSTRDMSYCFYILYIASFSFFTMALNGLSYRHFWPDNTWLANHSSPLCIALTIMSLIAFARVYMGIGAISQAWDRILLGMIACAAALLIMTLISNKYRVIIMLLTGLSGLVAAIGGVMVIALAFIKKSRPAAFFAVSMLIFFAGVIMVVLQLGGFIPATVVTVNGNLAGTALQMVILSFGLADRINMLRSELGALNTLLEIKVEERSAQLTAANEEMGKMNEQLASARDALWGEMQLAKKIQTVLLPKAPSVDGYDIAACMKPADDVGGDYYDVINADGIDWIAIGDVSGHGVPAGLAMMMVQTALATVINSRPGLTPAEVLVTINGTIYNNLHKLGDDKYMTISLFAARPGGEFVFSGLHQDIPIYRSGSNSVEVIDSQGMWIGIVDDLTGTVIDQSVHLETGDTMLLFTDGITEARHKQSDELFGFERLIAVFTSAGRLPVEGVRDSILGALDDYERPDDVTMVIIRRR